MEPKAAGAPRYACLRTASRPKRPHPRSNRVLGSGTPVALPLNPPLPLNSPLVPPPSKGTLSQPMEIVLVSNVTAPFRARARPQLSVAPVFSVMLVRATIFPSKAVVVPRVADLPTCQNKPSLFGPEARFSNTTDESDAVVRVLPIWKTQTAFDWPSALRMSVPVNCALVAKK